MHGSLSICSASSCAQSETAHGDDGYPRRNCHAFPDSPMLGGEDPLYSSSWEGAGLVLEAMRERGYEYSIGTTAVDRLVHAWFMPARDVIYINATPRVAEGQSWNVSPVLAVALAARAALTSEPAAFIAALEVEEER